MSWVARGHQYELLVLSTLAKFGMSLRQTGGPGDKGIDFKGFWNLPGGDCQVAIQCKGSRKPVPVGQLRDFEGALGRLDPCLGLLVSQAGFTSAAQRQLFEIRIPLILARVSGYGVQQFRANPQAQKLMPDIVVADTPRGVKLIHRARTVMEES